MKIKAQNGFIYNVYDLKQHRGEIYGLLKKDGSEKFLGKYTGIRRASDVLQEAILEKYISTQTDCNGKIIDYSMPLG